MRDALRRHWPEYLMEAAGLGLFMVSACLFGTLLEHPASPARQALPDANLRRLLMGLAMGATAAISFVLILTVLAVSSSRYARLTGLAAGALVATWITFEAPLSGMSMNPARTLASALPSGIWTAAWIYFPAPPIGMLLAAQAFGALTRWQAGHCAKLDHAPGVRCIFCEASVEHRAA